MKTNSSVLLFVQSEAEVGIIEKITLVNFMCHTMLEVNLGANVNFIIGRNGSESCRQLGLLFREYSVVVCMVLCM